MTNFALSAYRRLVRVVHHKFKGDEHMLKNALISIRARFQASRDLHDEEMINERVQEAEEAVHFIRDYVVQSTLTPHGTYRVNLTETQVESMQESSMDHVDSETVTLPKSKKKLR